MNENDNATATGLFKGVGETKREAMNGWIVGPRTGNGINSQ